MRASRAGCRWIDLQLVSMGYLCSLDGRFRHVPGLDGIAHDIIQTGARARWDQPVGSECACAYLWSRVIVLSPSLFEQPGWRIRWAMRHEYLHILYGRGERRIIALQRMLYPES